MSKRKVIRLKNLFHVEDSENTEFSVAAMDSDPESPSYNALFTEHRQKVEDELTLLRQTAEEEIELLRQKELADLEILHKNRLIEIEDEVQNQLDQGYQAGYQKGHQEGENKLTGLAQELILLINSTVEEKNNLLKKAGQEVLNLGFAIAEKIIQTKLKQDASIFKNILEEALSKVTQKDRVLIKINPSELQSIKAYQPHLEQLFKDIKQLDIVPDPDIEVGGCIIETKMGYVDSSISTKKELIQRAFTTLYDEIDNPDTVGDTVQETEEDQEEEPLFDLVDAPEETPEETLEETHEETPSTIVDAGDQSDLNDIKIDGDTDFDDTHFDTLHDIEKDESL